ncbi:MAG: glycosyltransferase family 2 protein [Bacteroidaceae bacterium]|nr:glycosyltransferase family 2 protein [Bacteroidaceae bacterium]
MCKVAIVILNWNGAEMMRHYLPSVIQCSQGEGIEVIVADNASTDNSILLLQTEFPDIRIIQLDKNYGFADGYNRALHEVEATYYLLLNSDVEIRQPGWLQPMTKYMDTHPQVAACQPKLLKLQATPHRGEDEGVRYFEYAGASGGFIDKYGYPYCRGRVFDTIEEDKGQYDEIASVMWTTGAAMMVRSDIYWKAGGLDARFFAHMEEIDLCWRMRIMGYELVCIPQSSAFHLGGATLNQGNPRKTFLNFRNNLLMLYKNLPESQLTSVLKMRTLLDWVAALQFLIKCDPQNMKAIFKAHKEFKQLKPLYATTRQRIQNYRTSALQSEMSDFSLLWQYYIKGRKTYKALHLINNI